MKRREALEILEEELQDSMKELGFPLFRKGRCAFVHPADETGVERWIGLVLSKPSSADSDWSVSGRLSVRFLAVAEVLDRLPARRKLSKRVRREMPTVTRAFGDWLPAIGEVEARASARELARLAREIAPRFFGALSTLEHAITHLERRGTHVQSQELLVCVALSRGEQALKDRVRQLRHETPGFPRIMFLRALGQQLPQLNLDDRCLAELRASTPEL